MANEAKTTNNFVTIQVAIRDSMFMTDDPIGSGSRDRRSYNVYISDSTRVICGY